MDSVTRSLILRVVLYIVVCPFTFGHCVVGLSSSDIFLVPLLYLQALFNSFVCSCVYCFLLGAGHTKFVGYYAWF